MSNVIAFVNPFQSHKAQVPAMDVLVVDGDAETRERMRSLLSKAGHRSTIVECGEDALDHLGAGTTQVVFAAHRMPDMDAPTLAKTLRLMQTGVLARTYVVSMAFEAEQVTTTEIEAAGITDVLEKPVPQARLLELLAHLSSMVDDRGRKAQAAATPAPAPVRSTSFDPTVLDDLASMGLGIEFEREFISQCLGDVEEGLANMATARDKGDWRFMREYAQGVKGVAGNVGLVRLVEIASSVVKAQDWKLVGESAVIMERLQEALTEGRTLLLERLAVHEQAAEGSA